jgi:D-arabinose 1-dehydrogenase-like Zn-dependent alcohol dehydrogenase
MHHWDVTKGKKVGVVGLGGLGHMGVKIAHALGAHVVVFTTSPNTYSSLLRANRVNIKVMQELLRHASSRVTLDTYTQAVTSQKREAQSNVVQLLRGPMALDA